MNVVEVGAGDFAREVIERSNQVPVLVDFWADWCGPCRLLGPVLERLAAELNGRFVLAKVDTQENQELAARFGVRGIPNCKMFKHGVVVDEFVGALPEAAVREFLGKHCPSEADEHLAAARVAIGDGRPTDAASELAAAQAAGGQGPAFAFVAAEIAIATGKLGEARELLSQITPADAEYDKGQALLGVADLAEACEGCDEASLRQRIAEDASDLDARFALGAVLALAGKHEQALDQFLELVARDRSYRDDGARKAMLTIFALRPADDELVRTYRRKLTIYL